MDEEYREILARQQYRTYRDHGAVKLCHWMKESMVHGRVCYKQEFYGIKSHRCLQMTTAFNECSLACLFCWRVQGRDFEVTDWAEPKDLLDNLIEMQRSLITGFKGDPRCDLERYEEARNPTQVAISLAGEPIAYPYMSDFLRECHSRGMMTFLVTNGTYPDRIADLDVLPRQLYVTVAAPDETTYKRLCRPKDPGAWSRLNETLAMMPSLDTRTVIRHTLVKGMNLSDVPGYAALDRIADPDMVEPKGYVFVGGSRKRLTMDAMPSFAEIKDFSHQLSQMLGMQLLNEREDSRVALIGKPGLELDVGKHYGIEM
ncbi:MAG: 4-demethylwyosine synthase TYW1 [Thermoplasmatales archaeon]|nr:4-demethylwyosine synthase TYW1 [Thermoplasmatales archaeon]